MITIADCVEEIVHQNPFVIEFIQEGMLNYSGFARKIIPEIERKVGREVKLTSVVMALYRMSFGHLDFENKRLQAFFKKIKNVLVRGHIAVYMLKRYDGLTEDLSKFLKQIAPYVDAFCTFSQGIHECTIILSEEHAHILKEVFDAQDIIDEEHKLTAFTILLPLENRELSGIYYFILKQLAWYGINIVEVVSTSNEFTLVVEEKDSSKTFTVLQSLGRTPILE